MCILGLYTGLYRSGYFSNHCILQNKHSTFYFFILPSVDVLVYSPFLNRNSASGSGLVLSENSGFSVLLEVFQKLVSTSSATLDFVWWKCINVTNEGYAPVLMSFSVTAGVWAFLCVCILTMGFPLWQVVSQPASLVWLSVRLYSFFLVSYRRPWCPPVHSSLGYATIHLFNICVFFWSQTDIPYCLWFGGVGGVFKKLFLPWGHNLISFFLQC